MTKSERLKGLIDGHNEIGMQIARLKLEQYSGTIDDETFDRNMVQLNILKSESSRILVDIQRMAPYP